MQKLISFLLLTVSVSGVLSERIIQQQDPCQAKNLIVPDVDYCDRYWECLDGQAELYDCPNGLVWVGRNRGIADGCDYPWRNPSLCQDKDLANPPISTEHCDWLYGIFGHETSCTRYWTCWNGTATEQFCVGGLLYNEETHACDWPQNVLGCQKHPLCKDDANGNVPLGKSCNRYWACQGGYPRLQRCPAMLVFDKLRKRCVSPPTADCDIPATTPASVPHIGKAVPEGGKPLKRSGGRRRNGAPTRNAPIPLEELSGGEEISGAEAPFAIPQDASELEESS
eukprot:TRINITY_DN341_c0_g1_i1.p1 TRINITY_DN341_c0_g1~~TRINITY_DN341_c0_g1_i1.p1  ORF type:complete len:282 (-),score=66.03 TRINITY_DN341_c0_g1_i1:627-1472(-)